MVKVEKISIERLQPNDYNPNEMTESEFTEFVAEVQHLGRLPKPVIVRPSNNGEFTIIDGEHAWKAAKEVGLAEISCEVMDADDFEAMRQTYKRNQHGTHNKLLLAKMFKRMGKERGLSLRKLAKKIKVSEGTIRNTIEYLKAVKVRNGYAPGSDSEAAIADLTVRQVHLFNRLPETIGNMWLDSGADMKVFLGKAKDLKSVVHNFSCNRGEKFTVAEYLDECYGWCEKSRLLQYINPVRTTEQFTKALDRVKEWFRWEREYFGWRDRGYSREEFRKYARYYYRGIWPFGNDVRWMECALNMIIKPYTEDAPACFLITPEEFAAIIEQVTKYCTNERAGLSFDMFKDYFKLAVYEKTGKRVESKGGVNVRERFMQAEIEKEAPDYIRESKLRSTISKYALWQVIGELKDDEDKAYIEQIAHKLAEKEFVPRDKSCVMAKSERKFELSLGKDVKLEEEKWAIWSYINKMLVGLKAEIHRDTAGNIELAMEVTDFVYKKDDAPEAHKKMSVLLSQLQEVELKRLHSEITYCRMVREMRSI